MPVISFNPADPADFGRAFAEFVHMVDGEITRLSTEVQILACIIQSQARLEDLTVLQNVSADGHRSSFLQELARDYASRLCPNDEPQRLKVLEILTQPLEPPRPKFAVVGGTDTAPAAGQSDGLQQVEPIACAPAQEPVPPIAGDPTTT